MKVPGSEVSGSKVQGLKVQRSGVERFGVTKERLTSHRIKPMTLSRMISRYKYMPQPKQIAVENRSHNLR
ncbi:hypothetical protein D1AOALGA4SA_2396 [Olavius algarvensis Delta 1 endosymbiont]|nr:hypothetical protein D1AOALGA4SA_2396 [Olavius algarvensis Delta 1 endosymbiont]